MGGKRGIEWGDLGDSSGDDASRYSNDSGDSSGNDASRYSNGNA